MDQQIDSLSLKIGVDINKDELKKLTQFTRAISSLQSSINKLDLEKLNNIKVPKGVKSLQIFNQNIKDIGTQNNSKNLFLDKEADPEKATSGIKSISETVGKETAKMVDNTERLKQTAVKYGEILKMFNGGSGKGKSSAKKNPFEKLEKTLKRIKLIAFIKLIRGALNFIAKGIQQGINNLVLIDKEFNSTISNIKTNLSQAFNSVILIFRPVIEMLEPIVQQFSSSLQEIANQASKIQAIIKGQTKYTKLNAKYAEDYAKSLQKGQLFSFDTFNTLNATASPFTEEEIIKDEDVDKASEFQEKIKETKEFLDSFSGLFGNVFGFIGIIAGEIKKIFEYLSPAITSIIKIINKVFDVVNPLLNDLFEALDPILQPILHDLLPVLLDMVDMVLQPILDIFKVLSPIITGIVKIVSTILKPVIESISQIIQNIMTAVSPIGDLLKVVLSYIGDKIQKAFKVLMPYVEKVAKFIDDILCIVMDIFDIFNKIVTFRFDELGKSFKKTLDDMKQMLKDSGLLKVFGLDEDKEKKVEWYDEVAPGLPGITKLWGSKRMAYRPATTNPISQVGVSNRASIVGSQDQLTLAFENAIYNTGLLDAIQSSGIINIDGRDIAQSRRFKDELNRTNPNLKLR